MSWGPGAISATISLPSTLVLGRLPRSSSERLFFQLQLPLSQLSARRTPGGVDHRNALLVRLLDQRFQIGHRHPGVLAA
jgi:hypothetical protein